MYERDIGQGKIGKNAPGCSADGKGYILTAGDSDIVIFYDDNREILILLEILIHYSIARCQFHDIRIVALQP